MTREETLKIMAVLKAAYPGFYRGMSREDAGAAVNLWNTMFDKEPYSLVSAGVMALIAADTKGFPPAIGQVKEYIHRLQNPDEMTETEAWELVRKAVSRSFRNSGCLPGYRRRTVCNTYPFFLHPVYP